MKIDLSKLSEQQVFNLIKNQGMDFDQFLHWMDLMTFDRIDCHEQMKEFYEAEERGEFD